MKDKLKAIGQWALFILALPFIIILVALWITPQVLFGRKYEAEEEVDE